MCTIMMFCESRMGVKALTIVGGEILRIRP